LANKPARSRSEMEVDGRVAVGFRHFPPVITFAHTEVPAELAGWGVGSSLVGDALADVRRQGLKVLVRCSFIIAFMAKHPETGDLFARRSRPKAA